MTAPGCSSTSRANGSSSGWSGRWMRSERSAITQSSRCRSVEPTTGHGLGGVRPGRGARRSGGMAGEATVPLVSDSSVRSLTREEAAERAALLEVERYDIDVDLRGLLEGDWASTSTITFRSREPGARTFVDCVAEVARATLNGRDLDLGTVAGGRIPLPGPGRRQRAGVSGRPARHRQRRRHPAHGRPLRRARLRLDLVRGRRRPPGLGLLRPARPEGAARVHGASPRRRGRSPATARRTRSRTGTTTAGAGPSRTRRRSRRTSWWSTPAPSTSSAREVGGHSLGLFCRQSLRRYLERDADDLFRVTEDGLAFFGERFGPPFPQERYDQVFVPNLGGAMENWGCVTWTDACCSARRPPTASARVVATVLLHEMAHMWFGDLVTMRWWDDLWLNEAFASWAADLGRRHATEFTDAWASFLAAVELAGYATDMGPASHPIRGEVPDVAHAMANFDAITYVKGQAVLRQLVAYVGEDTLRRGAARLLPRPRLGQHPARRPDGGGRHRGRPGPVALDGGLVRPGGTDTDRAAARPGSARASQAAHDRRRRRGAPRAPPRIGSYRRRGRATAAASRWRRRTSTPPAPAPPVGPAPRRPAPGQRRGPDLRRGPHATSARCERC